MKRIIFIFFFLINFGYSLSIGDCVAFNTTNFGSIISSAGVASSCSDQPAANEIILEDLTAWYVGAGPTAEYPDYTCVTFFAHNVIACGDRSLPVFSQDIWNFCLLSTHQGCNFSNGVWYCPDGPQCPDGQTYNSSTEQCEDIPECPTTDELDQQAIQKCGSLDFVQTENCDPSTGQITITCKSCVDIVSFINTYCQTNYDSNISEFNCSENVDGSVTVSATTLDSSLCNIPSSDTTDTNVTDSDVDNTVPTDSNTSTTDSSSSTDSDSSSDTSTSSTDSSTSTDTSTSDNTCPDPCSLYNQVGVQTTLSTVDGYTCYTIIYPVYDNCSLQYHTLNGQCVSGCGDTGVSSTPSSDINVTLDTTPITSRIDKTNEKLDDIDQKLDDVKNLTPDGSVNFDDNSSVDSDTQSFLDTYKDFFNNIGNDIDNIKSSYDKVKAMLNSDDYQITALPDNITECPLVISIYNKNQTLDICKFISPYRPLLQLFFTLFFNIAVISFFLRLVIYKGDD